MWVPLLPRIYSYIVQSNVNTINAAELQLPHENVSLSPLSFKTFSATIANARDKSDKCYTFYIGLNYPRSL